MTGGKRFAARAQFPGRARPRAVHQGPHLDLLPLFLSLHTGRDDHLLRRLRLAADLGFDVPKDLQEALGELVGAKIVFTRGVTDSNEPVSVRAPRS